MKGIRLSVSPFSFSQSDLLCLRSTRSKYNASPINCLLFFFFFLPTLQPKINDDEETDKKNIHRVTFVSKFFCLAPQTIPRCGIDSVSQVTVACMLNSNFYLPTLHYV